MSHTEWNIPSIEDIEEARKEVGLNKSEMSRILEYSASSGYSTVINHGHISVKRMHVLSEYFGERGVVDWYLPTIEEIDAEIDRLGVKKSHMSISMGYESAAAVSTAINKKNISSEKYRRIPQVLEFHQENGYLPLPEEMGWSETLQPRFSNH